MLVTPALRSQIASLWDDMGGQSLLDTELALAAEREENAMLRARVEAGEAELLKFKSWFLDVTESFTNLSAERYATMVEKCSMCEKFRKERVAHAATKARLIELKARVTELEINATIAKSSVSHELPLTL